MTIEDIKEVTEVAKEKLKENGDIYSEHILAYISYLEKQIEKMKCCGNCKNSIITDDWNIKCPVSDLDTWDNSKCKKWELAE